MKFNLIRANNNHSQCSIHAQNHRRKSRYHRWFLAGPNGELDWFVRYDQLAKYAAEQLRDKDALLLGRVTYQLFASYWPTPSAFMDNAILPPHAELYNEDRLFQDA
jgi:dihydrofolate reductase